MAAAHCRLGKWHEARETLEEAAAQVPERQTGAALKQVEVSPSCLNGVCDFSQANPPTQPAIKLEILFHLKKTYSVLLPFWAETLPLSHARIVSIWNPRGSHQGKFLGLLCRLKSTKRRTTSVHPRYVWHSVMIKKNWVYFDGLRASPFKPCSDGLSISAFDYSSILQTWPFEDGWVSTPRLPQPAMGVEVYPSSTIFNCLHPSWLAGGSWELKPTHLQLAKVNWTT